MKRRARNTNELDEKDSKFSKLLFNKTEKLVQNFKAPIDNLDADDIDRKPVWIDDDDNNFKANIIPHVKSKELYTNKLKQKYEMLMGTPGWAKLKNAAKAEAGDDDDLSRTVGHLEKDRKTKTKVTGLKKTHLEIKRFPRLNAQTKNEGYIISCIDFHPKSSVALVAGSSGVVSLFSVGGDVHEKLHSIKLKKWNISSAIFAPNGNEAFITGQRQHRICVYNLIKAEPRLVDLPQCIKTAEVFKLSPDGRFFAISDKFDEAFIMCAKSMELLKVLKQNSNVSSLTFSHDSKQLYVYGVNGEVIIWDLSTYKSTQIFYDEGCVKASCISCSPCGRILAMGSKEGIVNIYQTENLNCSQPAPIKTISNLTTAITNLQFNSTTEILAIYSRVYPEALKLVHIPSYHIFMNFPTQDNKLGHVNAVRFSPNSGFMGIGNNKGIASLYRLKYYKNY